MSTFAVVRFLAIQLDAVGSKLFVVGFLGVHFGFSIKNAARNGRLRLNVGWIVRSRRWAERNSGNTCNNLGTPSVTGCFLADARNLGKDKFRGRLLSGDGCMAVVSRLADDATYSSDRFVESGSAVHLGHPLILIARLKLDFQAKQICETGGNRGSCHAMFETCTKTGEVGVRTQSV